MAGGALVFSTGFATEFFATVFFARGLMSVFGGFLGVADLDFVGLADVLPAVAAFAELFFLLDDLAALVFAVRFWGVVLVPLVVFFFAEVIITFLHGGRVATQLCRGRMFRHPQRVLTGAFYP